MKHTSMLKNSSHLKETSSKPYMKHTTGTIQVLYSDRAEHSHQETPCRHDGFLKYSRTSWGRVYPSCMFSRRKEPRLLHTWFRSTSLNTCRNSLGSTQRSDPGFHHSRNLIRCSCLASLCAGVQSLPTWRNDTSCPARSKRFHESPAEQNC